MSAERALFDAWREWRRLTRAGQKAISKRDWPFLLECQGAVRRIQSSLANLYQEAHDEWRQSNTDCAAKKKELRVIALELKDLLESNQKLLHAARAEALSRREKLEQAGRNLQRLQNSYSSARPPAWTSFS